jgi:hypothetical protein
MMRKLLLMAGLALLPITFGALWLLMPTDPINAENFDRIEVGMTEPEVVVILGNPDRDNGIGPPEFDGHPCVKCWSRPSRDTILVYFEAKDGRWIAGTKRCYFPTLWERATHWWNPGRLEEAA